MGKLSRLIPECGYVGLLFFTHFITSSSSRQPLDSDYVTLVNVAYGYEMAKEHWRSHLLCTNLDTSYRSNMIFVLSCVFCV